MTIRRLLAVSVATLAAPTISAYAGPCSPEIDRMQTLIDAKLGTTVGSGRSAPQSPGALLHRQPTPGSIAEAESKLGELPPQTVEAVTAAMERARKADLADDKVACEQALAEARRELGP
jgi:hypothetical protein